MGAPKMPNSIKLSRLDFNEMLIDLQAKAKGRSNLEVVDVLRQEFSYGWIFGITVSCTLEKEVETKDGSKEKVRYSPQLLHSHVAGAQTVLPIVDLLGQPRIKINNRQRDVMAQTDVYLPFWEKGHTVNPRDVYPFLGQELLELPRGGPEPGQDIFHASEAAEELGFKVKHSLNMGIINPDPGIFMTGLITLCAIMDVEESEIDEREAIHFLEGRYIFPEDALEMIDTDDAITLGTIRRARLVLPKLKRGDGIVPDSMSDEELEALIDFGKRLT